MSKIQLTITLFLSLIFYTAVQLHNPKKTASNQLNWTGKAAFNAYSLSGTIDIKRVSSKISSNRIEDLIIEIDMTSLNHENTDLKTHLRSKDFFEVDRFQTASFELSQPTNITDGRARLEGILSIKGIKKQKTFEVSIVDKVLILDIVINRIDYGITFNSPTIFEKMKDQAIADDFKLEGQIPLK